MVTAFVLIAGVTVVLIVGATALMWMGMGNILASLLPFAPWLVMVGTVLLILTELLLFFGNKDDRRIAVRDLCYLLPTILVSGGLWWILSRCLR